MKRKEAIAKVRYELRIKGLKSKPGSISYKVLKEIFEPLLEAGESALRLAIEGAGISRGRTPAWMAKALDIEISGFRQGSTVAKVDCPVLANILGSKLDEQDFWRESPHRDDTVFTFVNRTLADIEACNKDSSLYDTRTVESFLALKKLRDAGVFKKVEISCPQRPNEHFEISDKALQSSESLKRAMPPAQVIVLSGLLDKIGYSEKRFAVKLDDGQTIPGAIDEEYLNASDMQSFWGRRVSIKALASFKASGHVQSLLAQSLRESVQGDEVFAAAPPPSEQFLSEELAKLHSSGRRSPFEEMQGKWPGEESIEQLLSALSESH